MGSKGSQTTTQTQNQSYNPYGASYITNALDRATSAANQPFNVGPAPVAGFNPTQQAAFGAINNAQGMAQPYFQQAANFYSPQGAQDFLNPYTANVMANLKDVFGQQMSQTTGKLTQAAGGVGADRIAVGQANLAKEQGLAAGQTLSGMYDNAVRQAQAAGQGQMALGQASQNAALQGAQAQLGAGGMQQQLEQQQLNSPYQYALQQAAFPYQQAQFLAGITGSLAPGLGGATTGTGTTTTPAPSVFSQILGLGTAGLGALGGSGAFGGSGGKGSTTGQMGATYGGYGAGSNGWGSMGGVQYPAFAEGGAVPDELDDAGDIVPNVPLAKIQPHIPQLNLNPPQQSGGGGGGGGGAGDIIGMAMKFLPMMLNRGGSVRSPYYADGGDVDAEGLEDRFMPVQDAIATGTFDPQGINSTTFQRSPNMIANPAGTIPLPAARPEAAPVMAADDAGVPPSAAPAAGGALPPQRPMPSTPADRGFLASPWAALTAAGLGMAAGTSPNALTNIGQGGLQGLRFMQQQQAAEQKQQTLEQEAQSHYDQLTRMTPYQQATIALKQKELSGSDNTSEVASLADGIESGLQPPTLTGLYGKSAAVRAELQKRKVPLANLQLQYSAAQKQISSLNGPQMTRFAGLATSVDKTIDEVSALADEMKNSGITALNRAKLLALVHTQGNTPKGQLATRYLTAVNTLKEEFANLAQGGYAPTEPAWRLANEQINADYGVDQLKSTLGEVQRLVRYRLQAIPNFTTLGPAAQNQYTGNPGPGAAAAAAPGHGAAPQSKPPVVYQNGHEYRLQPDGSYR